MSVIAPHRAAKPLQRKNNARLRRLYPYFLIGPAAVLTLVFLVYPVGSVFYYSLQHSNVTQPWNDGFAGQDNFVAMGADPLFWRSLTFTLQWVVVEVGLQFIFGLALALLINKTFIGRALARSLVFSPWAVSGILTTTIWILIYNPSTGIGRYLADIGIGEYGVSLLSGSGTTFWAVVLAEMWKGIPFFAILILADLQSVSLELYESADVDGAGTLRKFLSITWPHIRQAVVIATLLRAVWEFNNVDLLYTLTGGGPAGATTTLPLYVAQTAIHDRDFGYGSALTVVAFMILTFFSLVYLRITKSKEDDK
ncbi:multiple sugar transport system permease protein [Arthrobacter pascens]|uniref:carbohydrate ABC transporter permease n=1 Tax=Arthrobacter pascens TaxID=1677 RepID=UPI00278DCA7F|nr:sugar ABC transporter permease [Arthrobacter pascens]MDQ0676886.1 multiple sugar transport system permease protein [Arthrobacter pascens]